jgi:adenine-specific DNA-methyltransferase
MATIETLITQIDDPALRDKLAREVAEMKKRLDWGLVFERHLPENVRAISAPIKPGSVVWERRTTTPRRLRVRSIEGADVVVAAEPEKTTASADAPTERIARTEVLVEQDFAEPVFPVVTPIGAIRNGPTDAPYHAVIQGENYHAIQVLLAAYERSFDLIYLDPPYNTGNREWSYNNDYVDPNDTYRPSKWLAFMERRLKIARKLLAQDGIVVVAIDKNEHAHLVMLLEQLFAGWDITSVAIQHNPRGVQGDNFSYTNEFAVFVVPGKGLIAAREISDDASEPRFRDHGGESLRTDAATCFYPILIRDGAVVGIGDVPADDWHPAGVNVERQDGTIEVWPVDNAGVERKWRYSRWSVEAILEWLATREIGRGRARRWDIQITKPQGTHRTMWTGPRYDSGAFGTRLIKAFADAQFSFPKSLYNTRDVLVAAAGAKRDVSILDFFGGSGTTLHATMLLNAEDGQRRTCVLVTNNELKAETAERLNQAGHFRGDETFEAAGVYRAAAYPRVTAAVRGTKPDGAPIPGEYLDTNRAHAAGFTENVEFFRLDYLDPAEVEFGLHYPEIEPLLWLRAGAIGERVLLDPTVPLGLPAHSPYAVLFDPAGLPDLLAALPERPDLTHVFIVADSPESFAQIVADLPHDIGTFRLYRDYLETLRGATR